MRYLSDLLVSLLFNISLSDLRRAMFLYYNLLNIEGHDMLSFVNFIALRVAVFLFSNLLNREGHDMFSF